MISDQWLLHELKLYRVTPSYQICWHLWRPLLIENSVWVYSNSMLRGRQWCQCTLKDFCWDLLSRNRAQRYNFMTNRGPIWVTFSWIWILRFKENQGSPWTSFFHCFICIVVLCRNVTLSHPCPRSLHFIFYFQEECKEFTESKFQMKKKIISL